MKAGDEVTYGGPDGERLAVVTAITGAGASGFKRISLIYDGGADYNVLHENDRTDGAYWRLGVPQIRKRRR